MTGGVVLMTLLLNATTISTLVHRLDLDKPTRADQFLEGSARLLAIEEARYRLAELGYEDRIVEARLHVAEMEAQELLDTVDLSGEEELLVYVLRGLHAERRIYQLLSDAGLLRPIATRTLMQEIDDEIEEMRESELNVDAARREQRPWYALAVRRLLGWLPEPAGEDITEVAYSEVTAPSSGCPAGSRRAGTVQAPSQMRPGGRSTNRRRRLRIGSTAQSPSSASSTHRPTSTTSC